MSEEFVNQASKGEKKLINRGESATSVSWKNIKYRVDKSAFRNDSLKILMSSVYVTVAKCPKEGNRENVTNADDRLLTKKICTKALHPHVAPLGFVSFWMEQNTPSHHSAPPVSNSGPGSALSYVGLTLTPSCAHTAGISTGCNDPSLCLRTEDEMLYNLQ